MKDVKIGSFQAMGHANDSCIGIARFTAHEWEEGSKLKSKHSVEVRLRFDPETNKWEVIEVKQWEGGF